MAASTLMKFVTRQKREGSASATLNIDCRLRKKVDILDIVMQRSSYRRLFVYLAFCILSFANDKSKYIENSWHDFNVVLEE